MKRFQITIAGLMAAAVVGGVQPAFPESAPAAAPVPAAAAPSAEPSPAPAASPAPSASPEPASKPIPGDAPAPPPTPDWKFGGDVRVRYEATTKQQPTALPDVMDARHREVLRFRTGATKSLGKNLSFGVRMTTGSAEDPNSADVTISEFADELEVSLDRVYLEAHKGGLAAFGGKFLNPFLTTELVWDGDVAPQGVAASVGAGSGVVKPKLVGMLYLVDEQTTNPDSFMVGGQAQLAVRPSGAAWSATFAGGYYNYAIKSLRDADAGDTRSNRMAPGGLAYLSDYDLVDGMLVVDHSGFGKRYPVRLVADYVKNLGADDQDTGYGFDLFVGRAAEKGDLRFRYGYSQAETDAVLAAFSHDNTTLATNYSQHTATVDWQLRKDLQLNATWYVYRWLEDPTPATANPWINRLRLNALVTF